MTVPDASDQLRERLERLEEAVLYAERAGEQFGESIADLSHRLDGLAQRLARLEGRLGQVEQQQSETDQHEGMPPTDGDAP